MRVSVPTGRVYYAASPSEPERLLCWIPEAELRSMVAEGSAPADALEFYPDGVEVEASVSGWNELGIAPLVSPSLVREAFAGLLQSGELGPDGMVKAGHLEALAAQRAPGPGPHRDSEGTSGTLDPEPFRIEMSEGEPPLVVFRRLSGERR